MIETNETDVRVVKRAKVLDGKLCVDGEPIEFDVMGFTILESDVGLNKEEKRKLAEAYLPQGADTYYMKKKSHIPEQCRDGNCDLPIIRSYPVLYMKRK